MRKRQRGMGKVVLGLDRLKGVVVRVLKLLRGVFIRFRRRKVGGPIQVIRATMRRSDDVWQRGTHAARHQSGFVASWGFRSRGAGGVGRVRRKLIGAEFMGIWIGSGGAAGRDGVGGDLPRVAEAGRIVAG